MWFAVRYCGGAAVPCFCFGFRSGNGRGLDSTQEAIKAKMRPPARKTDRLEIQTNLKGGWVGCAGGLVAWICWVLGPLG